MNKEIFESNWKEIRTQAPLRWNLMNDIDLLRIDKAEVKYDKFVTTLQVKYGYNRDDARKELAKNLAAFDVEKKVSIKTK